MKEKEPRPLKTYVVPCMFGGFVVVRESPLDRLPWYWKLALAVGTLVCCWEFTIPVLDWLFRILG